MSRSEWVDGDVMRHILAALTTENKLAIITSLVTGLRISDVLALRTSEVQRPCFRVTEQKTLKRRQIRLPLQLRLELLKISGKVYVFEHRLDPCRHRTRQAVYKDIRRAARAFRVSARVTPHSARKIYAVSEYQKDLDVKRIKKLLNHDNEAVTMIYALADQITAKKGKKRTAR